MNWKDILKNQVVPFTEAERQEAAKRFRMKAEAKNLPSMIKLPNTAEQNQEAARKLSNITSGANAAKIRSVKPTKEVNAAIAARRAKQNSINPNEAVDAAINAKKRNTPLPKKTWQERLKRVGAKVGSGVKNQLTTRQRDPNPNAPSRLKPKQPDPNSRLKPNTNPNLPPRIPEGGPKWKNVLSGNKGPLGSKAPIRRVKRDEDGNVVTN